MHLHLLFPVSGGSRTYRESTRKLSSVVSSTFLLGVLFDNPGSGFVLGLRDLIRILIDK